MIVVGGTVTAEPGDCGAVASAVEVERARPARERHVQHVPGVANKQKQIIKDPQRERERERQRQIESARDSDSDSEEVNEGEREERIERVCVCVRRGQPRESVCEERTTALFRTALGRRWRLRAGSP